MHLALAVTAGAAKAAEADIGRPHRVQRRQRGSHCCIGGCPLARCQLRAARVCNDPALFGAHICRIIN